MTDANTLKPLAQMMLDVAGGKGSFERADLEVIRDNAAKIQDVMVNDLVLDPATMRTAWDAAIKAGAVEDITIGMPASLTAAAPRARPAVSLFRGTVGGTSYEEITEQAKQAKPRERY